MRILLLLSTATFCRYPTSIVDDQKRLAQLKADAEKEYNLNSRMALGLRMEEKFRILDFRVREDREQRALTVVCVAVLCVCVCCDGWLH